MDLSSFEIAKIMWDSMAAYTNKSVAMMDERTMDGQNPNKVVDAAMADADVIFGCTKFSLFHCR